MENKELKFKTNLNCGGCVAKVTPGLNDAEGIEKWGVDTENSDKVLYVDSSGITADEIIDIVQQKGFVAEEIISDAGAKTFM